MGTIFSSTIGQQFSVPRFYDIGNYVTAVDQIVENIKLLAMWLLI